MAEKRRIADEQLTCHFITFSVARRRRVLGHELSRSAGVPVRWID